MNQIHVHIGLPKTATTSLQKCIFQNLPADRYLYLGTRQPRTSNSNALFEEIITYCSTPQNGTNNIPKLRREIDTTLESRNIVLSEEMLTVDTAVRWQQKLTNLRNLFEGRPVSVLVTIRNPSKASFSLYVELYRKLQPKHGNFLGYLESNQALIYDYKTLLTQATQLFDPNAVHIASFEQLIRPENNLQTISNFLGYELTGLELTKENDNKKKIGNGTFIPPLSLSEYIDHKAANSHSLHRFAWRCLRKGTRPIAPLLHQLQLPWTARVISPPDNTHAEQKYQHSNTWLMSKYGIEYQDTNVKKTRIHQQ